MATVAVLVTGRPGCGKTTLIRRLLAELGMPAGGFYTEELRRGGRREGFQIVTLDGRRAVLASVASRSRHRVSRYGVELGALESVGVPAIQEALESGRLVVVDEIGKMELLSERFRQLVADVLERRAPLLATIMMGPHPFADALKVRPGVRLFVLTEENRQRVEGEALQALREMVRP